MAKETAAQRRAREAAERDQMIAEYKRNLPMDFVTAMAEITTLDPSCDILRATIIMRNDGHGAIPTLKVVYNTPLDAAEWCEAEVYVGIDSADPDDMSRVRQLIMRETERKEEENRLKLVKKEALDKIKALNLTPEQLGMLRLPI